MAQFRFRQFVVDDGACGMKICSDSVLLAAWLMRDGACADVADAVDAGTGSGVLALLLACRCPQARVTALEIDPAAAEAAEANFAASPWAERLRVVRGDFAAYVPPRPVDLVISNPPYFEAARGLVSPDGSRAAARHADSLSYSSLLRKSAHWLAPHGLLAMVSPAAAEQDILFAATLAGLCCRELCRVKTTPRKSPSRLLWTFTPAPCPMTQSALCMRDPDGTPAPEYRRIVQPYYLKI